MISTPICLLGSCRSRISLAKQAPANDPTARHQHVQPRREHSQHGVLAGSGLELDSDEEVFDTAWLVSPVSAMSVVAAAQS